MLGHLLATCWLPLATCQPLVCCLGPLIGDAIWDKQYLHSLWIHGLWIHGLEMHGSVLSEMFSSHCWVTSTLFQWQQQGWQATVKSHQRCFDDDDDKDLVALVVAFKTNKAFTAFKCIALCCQRCFQATVESHQCCSNDNNKDLAACVEWRQGFGGLCQQQ